MSDADFLSSPYILPVIVGIFAISFAVVMSDADWYVVCNYDERTIYNKYNSYLKENYISFNFRELNQNELIILVLLLSKEYFKDKNILDDIKKETLIVENEITDKIYKLYHETRLVIIRQLQDNNKFEFLEAIKYESIVKMEQFPRLVSDGEGGAIIIWRDYRSFAGIYAQRVNSSGHIQWTLDGITLFILKMLVLK